MKHRHRRGAGRGGFGGFRWWVEMFSLALMAKKPMHGYEISSELKNIGFPITGVGSMGNIYRILTQLEELGYVISEWDTSYSPPRKIYKITPLGMEYLLEIKNEIKNLEGFIEKFKEILGEIGHGK